MAISYVPKDDSLLRYVPYGKLRRDGEDNVIGVMAVAFRLRPEEEYLSATWIEYFKQPNKSAGIHAAVNVIRSSSLRVGSKSGYVVGQVEKIANACVKYSVGIRVVHEREPDNQAHVAVRRWPRENDDLFNLLADEVWAELHLNSAIS